QLSRSFARDLLEEFASPEPFFATRTGCDERKGPTVLGKPSGVAPEFSGIFLGSEVSAAAPRLVAHPPVLDVEGISVARGGSLISIRGAAGWGGAGFDPMLKLDGQQTAKGRRKVRFGSDQLTKLDKFIGAEFVRRESEDGREFCGF